MTDWAESGEEAARECKTFHRMRNFFDSFLPSSYFFVIMENRVCPRAGALTEGGKRRRPGGGMPICPRALRTGPAAFFGRGVPEVCIGAPPARSLGTASAAGVSAGGRSLRHDAGERRGAARRFASAPVRTAPGSSRTETTRRTPANVRRTVCRSIEPCRARTDGGLRSRMLSEDSAALRFASASVRADREQPNGAAPAEYRQTAERCFDMTPTDNNTF